ncbi:MAG: O-acetylhomoserine aminocarboxypropyltransferase/cysteine synthase [Ruminococcus sp.]|nr:O-acetylhomoserine aminocarboxypropyltransferase/cysteine synthase [Ruminococcus sp.]
MRFNTALLHKATKPDKETGATNAPICQTSAFAHDSAETLERVFAGKAQGYAYTRIGNPTVTQFEQRINALEGGVGAVACSSGMAAVTLSLLNILSAGDELIASSALFGGTIDLMGDLSALGITVRFAEHITPQELEPLINEKTKAVFTELVGNPRLDIVDIRAVADFLHNRSDPIPLIVDSTTATPYLITPLKLGADIVVHSTSKYINGSGNAISGIIVDGGRFRFPPERYPAFEKYSKFGPMAYIAKLRGGIWRNIGACLSPVNAFLNGVGLETLGLRMERLCSNALELARFFEQRGIEVNYPALERSPYYGLCQSQLGGKGGAILTIRAGSRERAFKLINSLKYALIATNIGDVRTLVIHPASTIYLHSSVEARESAGVYDDTIRISVGIEDIEDLREDFAQALDQLEG